MTEAVQSDGSLKDPSLKEQALNGAKWSVVDKWMVRIFSLVTFVLLGRLVAPESFGLLALAGVVVGIFGVLFDGGSSEAIIQRDRTDKRFVDTAFWVAAMFGIVLAAAAIGGAGLIGELYDEPKLAPVLQVLSITIVLNALASTQVSLLRRDFRFKTLAIRRVIATTAGGIVGVVWAIVEPSVWALVGQYMANAIVGFLVLWVSTKYRPSFQFDRALAKDILHFGTGILTIRVMTLAQSQGDYFVIGLLVGTTQLGYYVIGFRLFEVIRELISGTIETIGLPTFSRMQQDRERITRAILSITSVCATIAIPVFAGSAALAGQLIPLLFGPNWGPSIPVMQFLSVVGVLSCVTFLDRSAMIALGRMKLETTVTFFAVAKNLVAFVIGAQWGINGVAACYAAFVIAFWPVRLLTLRSATGLPLLAYLAQWARPFAASMCMVGVILLIDERLPSGLQLPMSALLGAGTYLSVMYAIGRSNLSEVATTVSSMLPHSIRKRFAH